MRIGFIGQGFIGKSYADDFEKRGFDVVRYTRSAPYAQNKDHIKGCDVVFIAVPAPTTPKGFDDSTVGQVLSLVGDGKIAVIKCTMLPGSTERLQKKYPKKIVFHSPEFLVESTAAHDAAHPTRNIIGISRDTPAQREAAEKVMSVLPNAPFTQIISSRESELVKYAANCFLYTKVVFANAFYDIAKAYGCDWNNFREAVGADPRIGQSHFKVVDVSRHPGAKPGRGAGGHCFIKDFAALRSDYKKQKKADKKTLALLRALEDKNISLLKATKKDIELLKGVYGTKI
ncbi:MAG: NAD(P)-binding domain-containing protein [Patescibacteria group bacterium]